MRRVLGEIQINRGVHDHSAEKQMIDTLLSVNLLIQRPIRQVGGTAESTQQPVIILIANTHGPYLCRVLWAGCVFSVHGACLFNVHIWECTWAEMHMEHVCMHVCIGPKFASSVFTDPFYFIEAGCSRWPWTFPVPGGLGSQLAPGISYLC